MTFHPYLLKEYNNRWFLLGVKGAKQNILTIALDRIQAIQTKTSVSYITNQQFSPKTYYKDIIGVTVNEGLRADQVELFVYNSSAPYVLTKPIHHSQELVERQKKGVIIRLTVKHNFELEREILGFGETMIVLKPKRLRNRIEKRIREALDQYQSKQE